MVPQGKSQWIGFIIYSLVEFLVGKTKFNSVVELIWELLKLVYYKFRRRS